MELDPKGLEAACRTTNIGFRDFHVPENVISRAIRAYLEAAPSPSPAPGAVEALRLAVDLVERDVIRVRPSDREELMSALSVWNAALTSISQPAKGEREGGGHD